jgi:tetratricopeptide (TPR) repeat protein
MKLSRYDQGLIYSRKAFELDPKSKETGLNCAGCELIAGDVNKAISILEKVLEDNPDYPPALARLCAAYLIGGQQEAGLSHLERLRGLRFDCADALSEQARTFFSQDRLQDAIVLLEAAIQSKNINSEIHRLLAECKRKLGSQVPLGSIHASDTATGEGAAGANECLT